MPRFLKPIIIVFAWISLCANAVIWSYGLNYVEENGFLRPRHVFDYFPKNGGIKIIGYSGDGGSISIPNSINGSEVTTLGVSPENEFAWYGQIDTLFLPKSLREIDQPIKVDCIAFKVDPANTSFSSRDGVLFNKEQTKLICFPGRRNGTYSIPDGVTILGKGSFCGSFVAEILIPSSVKEIEEGAFTDCRSLSAIRVDEDNPMFCSESGVLFDKEKTVLVRFPSQWNRDEFRIPPSVKEIAEGAFTDCRSISAIEVDTDNQMFCSENGVLFDKEKTVLVRCPPQWDGDEIKIPSSVIDIRQSAFQLCCGLKKIELPDGITSIGVFGFQDCTSLEEMEFPASLISIGTKGFAGCKQLKEIRFLGDAPKLGNKALNGVKQNCQIYVNTRSQGFDAVEWKRYKPKRRNLD